MAARCDLLPVAQHLPQAVVDLKYATADNFTHKVVYPFREAYLRRGTLARLARACDMLAARGFRLCIWDAYRPVPAQLLLWYACSDPTFVSPPYARYSDHCRGNTVDVTLLTLNGQAVAMPTGFDDFTPAAHRSAYAAADNPAANNARLLEEVMTACGFVGYSAEWWHFTDTDPYPVQLDFPTALQEAWQVTDAAGAALRRCPDANADALAHLPTGTALTLLGWWGPYAWMQTPAGAQGYVRARRLAPAQSIALSRVALGQDYSFPALQEDLQALCAAHPTRCTLDTIGRSALGRPLYVVRVGDPAARCHILVQGAMHAREYAAAWVMAAQLDDLLTHWDEAAWAEVCLHLIPMINPDGAQICHGEASEAIRAIYESDLALGYTQEDYPTYLRRYKANALGVDLNRNFDAAWARMQLRPGPSSQQYKGAAPADQCESAALVRYTHAWPLAGTLSYHATGSLIYHAYGDDAALEARCLALGQAVQAVSGYPCIKTASLDAGGYKDWVIDTLKLPSLTIEIGCDAAPLQVDEQPALFARNRRVLQAAAAWYRAQACECT